MKGEQMNPACVALGKQTKCVNIVGLSAADEIRVAVGHGDIDTNLSFWLAS
jgi:hypothetical protein